MTRLEAAQRALATAMGVPKQWAAFGAEAAATLKAADQVDPLRRPTRLSDIVKPPTPLRKDTR